MRKIISLDTLETQLAQINDRIILVGGCFDIIHPGHIEFLVATKRLSGNVVALLESDASVQALKGKNRPIHTQQQRAMVLSHLDIVDTVIMIPQFTTNKEYEHLVRTINPDIIAVTKGDPIIEIKKAHAEKIGAQVIPVLDRQTTHSSSQIASRLNI